MVQYGERKRSEHLSIGLLIDAPARLRSQYRRTDWNGGCMFCPSCGFEYTQKTNYCKRCGESLSVPASADAPKTQRSKIAGMFWAVAVFCLLGLVTVLNTYDHLVGRGAHDNELL